MMMRLSLKRLNPEGTLGIFHPSNDPVYDQHHDSAGNQSHASYYRQQHNHHHSRNDNNNDNITPLTPKTTEAKTKRITKTREGSRQQIQLVMTTSTMRSTVRCNSGGVLVLLLLLVLSPMVTVVTASANDDIITNNIKAAETTFHQSPQLRGNKHDAISPEFTTDINHRALAKQCSRDPTLIRDGVWYTIELEVFSMEDLKCPAAQWDDVKDFLEDQLQHMDLYKEFMITDLSPDLCYDPDAVQRRKLEIRNPDNPSDPGLLVDEDDERFAMFLESDRFEEHRRLGTFFFWYDLLLRGGDLCRFCRKDDLDHNSRLLLLSGSSSSSSSSSSSLLLLESEVDEGASDVGDLDDDDKKYYLDGGADDGDESTTFWAEEDLSGGGGGGDDGYLDMLDDKLFGVEELDDEDTLVWSNGIKSNDESTSRSLRCGGCVRLRGDRDKNGKKFQEPRYISTHEYWDTLYGVMISAHRFGPGNCRISERQASVFNMSRPGRSTNLGAPNKLCDESGPGVGDGGAPTLSDGTHNKVNSCHLGHTLSAFTVQGPSHDFEGCDGKFYLRFYFRYPVTLNSMGFMNAVFDDSIEVHVFRNILGSHEKHWFRVPGGGQNSAPKMAFHGMTNVVKVLAVFQTGGAVRYVDYCQICGDEEKAREGVINAFYPDAAERGVANKDSVTIFKDMIPDLSGVISTKLEHALHKEYRGKSSHCLHDANIGVATLIDVATKKGARQC